LKTTFQKRFSRKGGSFQGTGVCLSLIILPGYEPEMRGGQKMEATKRADETVTTKMISRPPIDLSLPDRIETATFALG
jgi:hypothetical protein